jgi:hypothetical protein
MVVVFWHLVQWFGLHPGGDGMFIAHQGIEDECLAYRLAINISPLRGQLPSLLAIFRRRASKRSNESKGITPLDIVGFRRCCAYFALCS